MGGDTILGFVVHLLGADLDLKDAAVWSEDGGVKRLVAVGLGQRDVVFDTADHRPVLSVDDAERFVAVSNLRDDDADGYQIIDPRDVHIMALELLIEPVEVLGASADIDDADFVFGQKIMEKNDGIVHVGLAFMEVGLSDFLGFVVVLGVEVFETDILKFALDLSDTETIGNWSIDLECFSRDAFLFFYRKMTECAHVVEAIGELDDDDADVLRHSHKHLAQIFEIVFFFGTAQFDLAELGDAIDQEGDVTPELFFDFSERHLGILGDIMEESGDQRLFIHTDLGQDLGHMEGMDDIVFTGFSLLAMMSFLGKLVGSHDEFGCFAGKRAGSLGEDVFYGDRSHHRQSITGLALSV